MGSRALVGVLAASWLAITRVAMAQEEGGTTSPFARGPGGRACGMGGAFVATADDASALVWNPGGVLQVTRLSAQAGYTQLVEGQAGEHFVAVAVPSWRWGSMGVALRHQGTGGIEARDENNLALPGALSASETELALGYARPIAPGVGLGAALKLQRAGVGEFAGTGYGADIGLLVDARPLVGERIPWAAPLSLGLAVRNALEPSQRLDRESVHDPRVLRLGFAWRRDAPGLRLCVAAALDHVPGTTTRLHTGVELDVGGFLTVRSGLQEWRPAAGVGLRWNDLSVDYAYEERDVGSIQHVGLSKSIGPTVSQSRDASRIAQERVLDARLDDAYDRRLAEQVQEMITRAREAEGRGVVSEALEAIAAARILAPADPRLPGLEAALLRADGARLERSGDPAGAAMSYTRVLEIAPDDTLAAAGQRRAQAEIERLAGRSLHARELDAAYGLFAAGDLLAARAAFHRLHVAMPNDSVTTAMLRRTEATIHQRVVNRLSLARRDMVAGSFEEASRGIEEARALGATQADLSTLEEALELERNRVRDPAAPSASPPRAAGSIVLTSAQRREVDEHYRRGLQAASSGQADAAMRFWELALTLDPTHRGAREALKREHLLRGMVAFGRGRFGEAETHWTRAVELDPADPRAAGYLERVRTQIVRTRELTGEAR